MAGGVRAPGLEPQDGPSRIDGPAWRLVTAGNALQVDPVFLELQVVFMTPNCADKPSQRLHEVSYQVRRKFDHLRFL
jgi:hypothetical protein